MALLVELLFFTLLVFVPLRAITNLIIKHKYGHHLPPGPIALPIIGHFHLLGPLKHRSLYKLSLRYGPLFSLRLGSVRAVVANTGDVAKQFLKTNEFSFIHRPATIGITLVTNNVALTFAPYGPYWKFVKKLTMTELLGTRSVNKFISLRARQCRRFFRFLAQKSELRESVNLSEELSKLTNTIMVQMVLGTQSASIEGRVEEARILTRDVTNIFGEFNLADHFWICKKLDLQGFEKRIDNILARIDKFLEVIIVEREEQRRLRNINGGGRGGRNGVVTEEDEDVKDFLDFLLDVSEDENAEIKLTRTHVKSFVMEYFTAGTDSTATAADWTIGEILNHPKVLEKAREEIDRVVGKNRLVGESDGPNLPYIQAIIKETLRLHPPFPVVNRKCVEACKIDKYMIPENTMLFLNLWAINRDPNFWENPSEFRPERFLEPNERDKMGPIDIKGQHFQALPFGSGRRICPGKNLVLQMLPGLVAGMIQCFDWKVVNGKMDGNDSVMEMDERQGMTLSSARDLVCVPVARFSPLTILDP
ncbi:licodione synthase [Ziziphus jujuba]|uniref:Licodione synthase n=2 Tax=Ziziphus jujuba TaxID=326968 RepID=A0A6P3YTB7_ZIZJJ|nr:licodione synthase [Ziziphus jujuba]KAH7520267.1 hypothetical protein FEM48_Zijuj08G0125900 [Ziziphus jujuba var. spinosa]